MSAVFPALLGVVTKVYDDITDMNIHVSPVLVESLKSLMIALLVYTTGNDFYLALSFLIVSLFNSGFDNPFWKSIAPVSLLLTLYTLPHAGDNAIYNSFLCILVVIGILVAAMFEDRLFSEEVSQEKLVSRILLVLGLGAMLVVPYMEWFMIPEFSRHAIHTTTIVMFTNMFVSVLTMVYFLYFSGKSLQELNPGRVVHEKK
jgi:hypothetical protein